MTNESGDDILLKLTETEVHSLHHMCATTVVNFTGDEDEDERIFYQMAHLEDRFLGLLGSLPGEYSEERIAELEISEEELNILLKCSSTYDEGMHKLLMNLVHVSQTVNRKRG